MASRRGVVEGLKVGRGAEHGGQTDSAVGAVVLRGGKGAKVLRRKSPGVVGITRMLVGEGGGEGPRGVSPMDPRLGRAAPQKREKQED